MKLQIFENLKHIVTHIGKKLKLFKVNKTGRPLKIKKADGSKEEHQIESGTLEISYNHATVLI